MAASSQPLRWHRGDALNPVIVTNHFGVTTDGFVDRDRGGVSILQANTLHPAESEQCFKLVEHELTDTNLEIRASRNKYRSRSALKSCGFIRHGSIIPKLGFNLTPQEYITQVTDSNIWEQCDQLKGAADPPLFPDKDDWIDNDELRYLKLCLRAIYSHINDLTRKLVCFGILEQIPSLNAIEDLDDFEDLVVIKSLLMMLDNRTTPGKPPTTPSLLGWSISPVNSVEYWMVRFELDVQIDKNIVFDQPNIPVTQPSSKP